jgi:hypothetical protein
MHVNDVFAEGGWDGPLHRTDVPAEGGWDDRVHGLA